MSIIVRGALNWPKKDLKGMFRNASTGKSLTPDEAREHLMDQLAKGHETLPCSNSCGNPCKHAGCAGFNYGAGGGCPGYPVDDVPTAPAVAA